MKTLPQWGRGANGASWRSSRVTTGSTEAVSAIQVKWMATLSRR
jgi:hypothetical protein